MLNENPNILEQLKINIQSAEKCALHFTGSIKDSFLLTEITNTINQLGITANNIKIIFDSEFRKGTVINFIRTIKNTIANTKTDQTVTLYIEFNTKLNNFATHLRTIMDEMKSKLLSGIIKSDLDFVKAEKGEITFTSHTISHSLDAVQGTNLFSIKENSIHEDQKTSIISSFEEVNKPTSSVKIETSPTTHIEDFNEQTAIKISNSDDINSEEINMIPTRQEQKSSVLSTFATIQKYTNILLVAANTGINTARVIIFRTESNKVEALADYTIVAGAALMWCGYGFGFYLPLAGAGIKIAYDA